MKHIVHIKHIIILFDLEASLPLLCGGSVFKGGVMKQTISPVEANQKSSFKID